MSKPLAIFGTAEIATLARFYFEHDSPYRVVAFTADDEYVKESELEGLPVMPFSDLQRDLPPEECDLHVGLSYQGLNQLRQRKYEQARAAGYRLATYVSSKSSYWPTDLVVGDNCLILEDQTIQPGVRIGNNVMLWSGNHIGHGTEIRDHVYIASQVCISGHCVIGERTFMGVNATTRDFVTIGPDTFVAMDASVVRDIAAGSVVLGARCEILDPESDKAERIRTGYFGR